jgi:hypothetical protein
MNQKIIFLLKTIGLRRTQTGDYEIKTSFVPGLKERLEAEVVTIWDGFTHRDFGNGRTVARMIGRSDLMLEHVITALAYCRGAYDFCSDADAREKEELEEVIPVLEFLSGY